LQNQVRFFELIIHHNGVEAVFGGVRKSDICLGKMLKLDVQVLESARDHANGNFVTAEEKTAQHTENDGRSRTCAAASY